VAGVEDVGQVDQRARDGRDRDAVVGGDVAGVEVAARPEPDPGAAPAPPRSDDVDLARDASPDAPQLGGAQVTQRRALAACKHGRQPAPLL